MDDNMLFTAGYVLIRAGTRDVHIVRDKLLSVGPVTIAHALIGPDDLICFLETESPQQFILGLDDGIRRLVDTGLIEHTETMMVLAWEGKGYSGRENRPAPAAAWLFCTISIGDPEAVIEKLFKTTGVVNAHAVIGRYDIIAYVEAASMHELMAIIDKDVRRIKEIRNTDTRLVLMKGRREIPTRGRGRQNPIEPGRLARSASTKKSGKKARV